MDDGSFVGGDGVGSVLERGADVIDGGLAGFDVERGGFEEDVGLGGFEPLADICRRFWPDSRLLAGSGRPLQHKPCHRDHPGRRSIPDGGLRFR